MRVYYTRALLGVVAGTEDSLYLSGRLAVEITPEIEQVLQALPKDTQTEFNTFATAAGQTIDYHSEPIVYMPDEFVFHMDIESLDRLAREMLIRMMPLYVRGWQTKYESIAELWIGGPGEVLTKDERAKLKEATRKVWALPVQGKVFVLDEGSIADPLQRAGTPDAIREAGGILHEMASPACDYFVTDRMEVAEAAREAGAKQTISTLVLTLMIGTRD
jgi:hypothetical protein